MERAATRHVFVSLVAQHDNLGDLVIRREMVRWLTAPGIVLHALVADVPDGFVAAVGLPEDAVLHRSAARWQAALLAHAARGSGGLVFAPGPQALRGDLRSLAHEAVNLANVAVLRTRRNPVAKIGRSLTGGEPVARLLERAVHRLAGEYWVRDTASASVLGRAITVVPDISLAAGAIEAVGAVAAVDAAGSGTARTVVALSPRHDRGWTADEVRALATAADAIGHRMVLVTQVGRDDARHAALAAAAGVEHLSWDGRDHAAHLARVTAVYATAALVITDRLHAALFGLACGATPVLRRADDPKLQPALAALGLPAALPSTATPLAATLAWRAEHGDELAAARAAAADTLRAARTRLRRHVGAHDG